MKIVLVIAFLFQGSPHAYVAPAIFHTLEDCQAAAKADAATVVEQGGISPRSTCVEMR
jgi:hypothetical protein